MKHKIDTEVLIVGAGSSGMLTAILLARAGVNTVIIDRARGPASHATACGIHPRSLDFMERAGVLDKVIEGRTKIEAIDIHEGLSRVAEVDLTRLDTRHPFAVGMTQSDLENILENRIREIDGKEVLWNHRLSKLQQSANGVTAVIDQLTLSGEGYGVATETWEVENVIECNTAFVVGADGHGSLVRKTMDIGGVSLAGAEYFSVTDVELNESMGDSLRIILGSEGVSSAWPLPENLSRWFIDHGRAEQPSAGAEKRRKNITFEKTDEQIAHFGQELNTLAPWLKTPINRVEWQDEMAFDQWLSSTQCSGRCVLIGDAAHIGLPPGAQSLNAGLADAAELSTALVTVIQNQGHVSLIHGFSHRRRQEWKHALLLGQNVALHAKSGFGSEIAWSHIPTSLPASGRQLCELLRQLGVEAREAEEDTKLVYS